MNNTARLPIEAKADQIEYVAVSDLIRLFGSVEGFCSNMQIHAESVPLKQYFGATSNLLNTFNARLTQFRSYFLAFDRDSFLVMQGVEDWLATEEYLTEMQTNHTYKLYFKRMGDLIKALRDCSKSLSNMQIKLVMSDIVAQLQMFYDKSDELSLTTS